MIHYMKSFTRVKAIMLLVAAACLSGIIGGFCGSLLTQEDRAKAKYSITSTKETLKKATAERDKLKREYARLITSQEQSQPDTQVSDMTRKFEAEESPWAPLSRRLDEIDYDNRKKLEKYNRRPGQKGYSLGVRRAAAIKTLMDKGYSREEATITVREIEKQGMLPDPPAR